MPRVEPKIPSLPIITQNNSDLSNRSPYPVQPLFTIDVTEAANGLETKTLYPIKYLGRPTTGEKFIGYPITNKTYQLTSKHTLKSPLDLTKYVVTYQLWGDACQTYGQHHPYIKNSSFSKALKDLYSGKISSEVVNGKIKRGFTFTFQDGTQERKLIIQNDATDNASIINSFQSQEKMGGLEAIRKTHPVVFEYWFRVMRELNMSASTISGAWRPALGSILHRYSLGLDVNKFTALITNSVTKRISDVDVLLTRVTTAGQACAPVKVKDLTDKTDARKALTTKLFAYLAKDKLSSNRELKLLTDVTHSPKTDILKAMKKQDLNLYTDYLTCMSGYATATGLSNMVDGDVSHDHITRFLSKREYNSKDLWLGVKSTVREVESEDGVLIFDDTIQEKPHTDESELICWHFDHCSGRNVKGVNFLNALYHSNDVSIPVAFEVVKKPIQFCDEKTGQIKRRSEITKNEQVRNMIETCILNQLKFRYVLMDSWFSAKENFEFITKHGKHFIAGLKDNRLVALSVEDRNQGIFQHVSELQLSDQQSVRGWLKGFDQEVLIARRVFINKDGSTGVLNLVCSDLSVRGSDVTTIYKKRWKVEEFHKSLKSNAALAKSPTRTLTTQNNHIFMSIYSVYKLECLKLKHHINHFAIRMKLLIKANQFAYQELQKLQSA